MTGVVAELPSVSPNLNPNFGPGAGQGSGRGGIQSASPAPGALSDSMNGADGANGTSDSNSATGSESFLANWRAMLASLEGSTGANAHGVSADDEAAGFAGQIGSLAGNSLAGKGSAVTPGNGAPRASANLSQSISALSAEKLVRLQQLVALRAAQAAGTGSAANSSSPAATSQGNGGQYSRSTKAAGGSDSSNSVSVTSDSIIFSPLATGMTAGINSQTAPVQSLRTDSAAASAANGRRPASISDSAFATYPLAVSGENGQSRSLAVSDSQSNGTAASSGADADAATADAKTMPHAVTSTTTPEASDAGAISNGLDPLATANLSVGNASEFAPGADSASGAQSAEASAAYSALSGRRASSHSSSDSSTRTVQRNQRISGLDSATQLAAHSSELVQGNSAAPAGSLSASSLAGSGAGFGSTSGSSSGSAPGASGSAAPGSARETFAALDGEPPSGGFSLTHAGANRAEAGFEDPTLGWVGVRADLDGGGVHASLVPGSAEAAQTLGSHLAGLNAYLAERHPAVAAVTVAGHENGGSPASAHTGSGTQSDSQSSAQQDSAGDSGSRNSGFLNSGASDPANGWSPIGSNPNSAAGEELDQGSTHASFPAAHPAAESGRRSSGSYISVMA
jgi:hypothetical protein